MGGRSFDQGWIHIFFYSFPNLAEGIIGVISTCIFLLIIFRHYLKKDRPTNQQFYFISVIVAAIYVIIQEFKLHNLGGSNVYDPWDVVFSVVGLVTGLYILFKLKPKFIQFN